MTIGAQHSLVGAELELEIERVAHGGVFVAHHEGRVVFLPDTMTGEVVRARITDDTHPSFLRAETLEVLRASAMRQPHIWSAAAIDRPPEQRAGGAEFGHIAPAHQRELKRAVLVDALHRIGHLPADAVTALDPTVQTVDGLPDGTRSRTRLRLHVDDDGRVGAYAAHSRRVIPVADLPLGVAALEGIAPLGGAADPLAAPDARTIDLVAPSVGEAFRHAQPGGGGPGTVTERVGGRLFELEARGFWQVHPAAPAALTAAVQRAIDSARFDAGAPNLDLYGGVGLLAAALGEVAGPSLVITSVEADRRASLHAAVNLRDWRRARVSATRVDRYLAAERVNADAARSAAVVLDPPRSGAGRAVVDAISRREPAQIVYVACDPVALARDTDLFSRHGYRIASLEAFDLFPNTHHLEAVAAFRR